MNKNTSFDHSQHPNQESKRGTPTFASNTKINSSTNDTRIEQAIPGEETKTRGRILRFLKNLLGLNNKLN